MISNVFPIHANILTHYFQNEYGVWEIFLPNNADGSPAIPHGSRVKVYFLIGSGNFHSEPTKGTPVFFSIVSRYGWIHHLV
jgi:hypothetical protein